MSKKTSLKIAVVVILITAGLFAGISESRANVAEATVIFLLILEKLKEFFLNDSSHQEKLIDQMIELKL